MRIVRALLTGLTLFLIAGLFGPRDPSTPNEARGVVGVMVAMTGLAYLYPYRKRKSIERALGLLACLAGIWGFFTMPRPHDDPDFDWLFPYYFSLATSFGYFSLAGPGGRPRRRALENISRIIQIPLHIGLLFIPLIWPLVYLHAAFNAEAKSTP